MSSSSNSPCAACKFLRRKCTQECVFAPYFPPDQPAKFASVHKVFGASNVAKILNELSTSHREDAVNSLAYEADARLRDPVYGCVGLISVLQHRLKQVQVDLHSAKQELATYMGPSAMMPNLTQVFMQQYANMQQPMLGQMGGIGPVGTMGPGTPSNMQPILGLQGSREAQQQQQLYEAQQQQLVDAAREQEMFRNFEQQQLQQLQQHQQSQHHQQIDLMRYNRGFDVTGPSGQQVNTSGFTHLTGPSNMAPSLALGGSYDNAMYQIQHEPQPQEDNPEPHLQQFIPQQLLVQQQVQQPQPEPQPQPQPQPQMHPQEHNGDGGSEEGMSAAAQLVRLSDNEQN